MVMKFDVIVVGGGPAGLVAAYRLAQWGFKTLVLERGRKPGSKNLFGGRIYAHALDAIMPEYRKEGRFIERWVRKERLSFMTDRGLTTLEFENVEREENSFTAFLTSFVEWLAGKAEAAGATLVTEITVDELVRDDKGRFTGVRAGNDVVYGDVIIDAEGVNRLLLERAGIVPKLEPRFVALGIKEVVKLDKKTIEDRFNLDEDEGLAWAIAGYPSRYLPGGGFIYTNRETVTLGVVIYLDQWRSIDVPVHEAVERFKLHPSILRLVKGGTLIEYGAHMTPVAGINMAPPRLYYDGLLIAGDAAGFLLHAGVLIRGVDFAVMSGALAAEAVKRAGGDYSAGSLSIYHRLLSDSFVLKELEAFREADRALHDPRLFNDYVKFVDSFLRRYFTVDGTPRRIYGTMREAMQQSGLSLWKILKDAVMMFRRL